MKVGQLTRNGLPARVLDVLETDGGWLTTEGVALQVVGKLDTVRHALYRLQRLGLVESRQVELAKRGGGKTAQTYSGNGLSGYVDVRREWRASW